MKWIILIIFNFSLSACAEDAKDKNQDKLFNVAHQQERVLQRLETYLKYDYKLSFDSQPLPIEDILQDVHPELISGKLITEVAFGFKLNEIPVLVRSEIQETLAVIHKNIGIGILQNQFWEDVFRVQDEFPEIQIIFLKNQGIEGYRIGGYFSFDDKVMAISATANVGTVIHELQHYHQWLKLKSELPLKYFKGAKRECLSALSTVYAELDATRVQMTRWTGLFDSIDLDNLVEEVFQRDGNQRQININIIQRDLWKAYISYVPTLISEDSRFLKCPNTIKKIVESIVSTLDLETRFVRQQLSAWNINFHKYSNDMINNNLQMTKEQQSDWKSKDDFWKIEFENFVANYDQNLIQSISKLSEKYTKSAFGDLCAHALGFAELNTGCGEGGANDT